MTIIRAPQNSVGQKRRGRPPGSKNKPKDLILAQQALTDLRIKVGPYLPAEDMEYLERVLDGQDSPELKKDLDIFLALQLKALLPQLAEEIRTGGLTREATQRSSTVKELLALRFQMEKQKDGDAKPSHLTFIQNVFESRGLDPERMARLITISTAPEPAGHSGDPRQLPSGVSGEPDGDEGDADESGTVPDSVPE
jgi:hypothetical protein